uniref:(northern house mosquito) hypothetical protein n=1 Tax=Culex pipiens TaxID=7175 RepID=A0A8D8EYW2_CULPI
MVLPDVRKAMSRRERLQVPHDERVPPAADYAVCGECGPLHRQLLVGIYDRISADSTAPVRYETSCGEQGLPGVHLRPAPSAHERDQVALAVRFCQVPRPERTLRGGRNREGMVHQLHRPRSGNAGPAGKDGQEAEDGQGRRGTAGGIYRGAGQARTQGGRTEHFRVLGVET